MRYCRNCNRILADDEPFCRNCCPPDADPEDNWAFAPLGNIVYIDDGAPLPEGVKVEQVEGADKPALTETQQLNMAFDFNDLTLVTEPVRKKQEVNYLDEVPKAPKTTGEQRKRTLVDLLGEDAALLEAAQTERQGTERTAPTRQDGPSTAAAGGISTSMPRGGAASNTSGGTPAPRAALSDAAESTRRNVRGGVSDNTGAVSPDGGVRQTGGDEPLPRAISFSTDELKAGATPAAPGGARQTAQSDRSPAAVSFRIPGAQDRPGGRRDTGAAASGRSDTPKRDDPSLSAADKTGAVSPDGGAHRTGGDEPLPRAISFSTDELKAGTDTGAAGGAEQPRQKHTFRASSASSVSSAGTRQEQADIPHNEKFDDPLFAMFAPVEHGQGAHEPARTRGKTAGAQAHGGRAQLEQTARGTQTADGGEAAGAAAQAGTYGGADVKEWLDKNSALSFEDVEVELPEPPARETRQTEEAGALEKQIKDPAFQAADEPVEKPYGKLGVTVVALLLAGLFIVTGFSIFRLAEAPSQEELVLEQLEGTWVSGEFSLRSDPERPLLEVLQIDGDAFSSACYEPNDAVDGYLTGEWPQVSEVSGTLGAYVEQSVILSFSYKGGTDDGEYYFIREILSLTDDELTLREYYDEARLNYYDLTFTRHE